MSKEEYQEIKRVQLAPEEQKEEMIESLADKFIAASIDKLVRENPEIEEKKVEDAPLMTKAKQVNPWFGDPSGALDPSIEYLRGIPEHEGEPQYPEHYKTYSQFKEESEIGHVREERNQIQNANSGGVAPDAESGGIEKSGKPGNYTPDTVPIITQKFTPVKPDSREPVSLWPNAFGIMSHVDAPIHKETVQIMQSKN